MRRYSLSVLVRMLAVPGTGKLCPAWCGGGLMKPIGSFHPLPTEFPNAEHVLFAFAVDTPKQRRAVHDEAMSRLKWIFRS